MSKDQTKYLVYVEYRETLYIASIEDYLVSAILFQQHQEYELGFPSWIKKLK